jgi:hypothetical protein
LKQLFQNQYHKLLLSGLFEKVELSKEYIAPQNSEVKLTFTKLPDPSR